jgi:hypothetical protein
MATKLELPPEAVKPPVEDKVIKPQQSQQGNVLIGSFDPQTGGFHYVNLDFIRQPQVLAEAAHILGIIDDRAVISATIKAGAAIGSKATAQYIVPSTEVDFLEMIKVTTPGESGVGVGDILQANFRISIWPDALSSNGQSWWATPQGVVAPGTYWAEFQPAGPFVDPKNMDKPLRLPAGAIITLEVVLTGAVAGADLTATLTPYGYRGKRIMV